LKNAELRMQKCRNVEIKGNSSLRSDNRLSFRGRSPKNLLIIIGEGTIPSLQSIVQSIAQSIAKSTAQSIA
jgi:hypothetical protein